MSRFPYSTKELAARQSIREVKDRLQNQPDWHRQRKVECICTVRSKANAGDFAQNVLRQCKVLQVPRNTLIVVSNPAVPVPHVPARMCFPVPLTVYHLDGHPLVHGLEHSGFPTGDGAPSVVPYTTKVGGGVGATVGAGIEKLEEKLKSAKRSQTSRSARCLSSASLVPSRRRPFLVLFDRSMSRVTPCP
jgi:hypothetical protein